MRFHDLALTALALTIVGCADATAPAAATSPLAPTAVSLGNDVPSAGQIAAGEYAVTVPAEVFGIVVDAQFAFAAEVRGANGAGGNFLYTEKDGTGPTNRYVGSVTCFSVYDFDGLTGNRAKIGGVVESSTDPSVPPGTFMWWQSIDEEGRGPGKTTLAGVGDAVANEAFCASNAPPRFGPFPIRGVVEVHAGHGS